MCLTMRANVDYQRAVSAVAAGATDEVEQTLDSLNDLSGLDVSGDGVPVAYNDASDVQPSSAMQLSETNVMREIGPNDLQQTDFFAVQDSKALRTGAKRQRRKSIATVA